MSSNITIRKRVINLNRRPDRMMIFNALTAKYNITDIERYSAVDGRTLERTPEIEDMFKDNEFNWRRSIVATTLSHYNLWKELINSDFDYYLIFEDDILLFPDFNYMYRDLIKQLSMKKKRDEFLPFIYLGYHTDQEYLRVPPFGSTIRRGGLTIYEMADFKHVWGGFFSYIIHRDFARVLVDKVDSGIKKPVDTLIYDMKNIYMVYPTLVFSPFMTFTNNADSDIQYDHLEVGDEYIFFSKLDSKGHDIHVNTKYMQYHDLKKIANEIDGCVAFNSYGYFKSKIEKPLIPLPNCMSKKHGLYVKKSHWDKVCQEKVNKIENEKN